MRLRNKKTEIIVEILIVISWVLLTVTYIYFTQDIDFGDEISPSKSTSEYQNEPHVNNNFDLYIPNEYEGDE